MADEAARLAATTRGAMVAPAGCGKTHTIAEAVAKHAQGRQLVLTHTHAGVDALRTKLKQLGAAPNRYEVDTIAGWSLRLAASFPKTSALPCPHPRTHDEYAATYRGAVVLLRMRPHKEILRASYSGIFVDEYQDCTEDQHRLVLALRDVLPTRVVGDPLQGIFGFGSNQVVRWREQVDPEFESLPGPSQPRRWEQKNRELGDWLRSVRGTLEAGNPIDLTSAPVRRVDANQRSHVITACHDAANRGGSVVAIPGRAFGWQDIAGSLRGRFLCVEPMEATDLFEGARAIGSATGADRTLAMLDFAGKCMTRVGTYLSPLREALAQGRPSRMRNHQEQVTLIEVVRDGGSLRDVAIALESLAIMPDVVLHRRELWEEMLRAIRRVLAGESLDLLDAAWSVRNMTRQRGRRCPTCAVGSTLLVKGLEFDHAVLLDADAMDAQHLYVALTRGSRSLTIASRSMTLQPTRLAASTATPARRVNPADTQVLGLEAP